MDAQTTMTAIDPGALKAIAAGVCMGLGAWGPAVAEGYVAGQAMRAIGRNPEASDKINSQILVLMAVCESTGIYALVVSLIILFT